MPERIQMSRQHPWRADNPDAVRVDRTTKWGNPFRVGRGDCELGGMCWRVNGPAGLISSHFDSKADAAKFAVRLFANWMSRAAQDDVFSVDGRPEYFGAKLADRPTIEEARTVMSGRDLACWCPLDQPCHADVLIEIANV